MQDTLKQCERDVEASRARFARDLAALRSPSTFEAFTDGLKQDVIEAKDQFVDRAKDAMRSKVTSVVDELKAKAAANPAAALAIGAGLGWHFLRHPPVTTVLVGLGLYSLLRTPASPLPNAQTGDYLRQGQARLKEQARELASHTAEQATSMAAQAGEMLVRESSQLVAAAKEKSGQLLDTAQDPVRRFQHDTRDRVADTTAAVQKHVTSVITKASNATDQGATAPERVSGRAGRGWDSTMMAGRAALPNVEARDRILLSMAGLAVATAFGFACQRRIAADAESR